jgi:hypothetical protein
MKHAFLFLAAAAFAPACNSTHQTQAAVAEARLPQIRYYAIADT